MDTTTTAARPASLGEAIDEGLRENYISADHSIKSWLLTKDHKRIAILYLIVITLFFMMGGAYALMIRLELLTPAGDRSRRRPTTSSSRRTAS